MSAYWYVGNDTKKEYLDCPARCGVKELDFQYSSHCIPRLLIRKLFNEWNGDKLYFWNDHLSLPWWEDDTEWKNVTLQSIKDFNEHKDNNELIIRCNTSSTKLRII